jgi:hypothetical protein
MLSKKARQSITNFRMLPIADRSIFRAALGETNLIKNIHLFREIGIHKIIDLRNQPFGNILVEGIQILQRPMSGLNQENRIKTIITNQDLITNYLEILEKESSLIIKVVEELIQAGNQNILIGCNMGKDRTGIIAYMLMRKLKIPLKIIAEDYAKSKELLLMDIDMFENHWSKRNMSRDEYTKRLISPEEIIDHLDTRTSIQLKQYLGIHV